MRLNFLPIITERVPTRHLLVRSCSHLLIKYLQIKINLFPPNAELLLFSPIMLCKR